MFDTILLPVDGSEGSDRAAHVAADLATRYGAQLVVLHVSEREHLSGLGVLPGSDEGPAGLIDRYVRRLKDLGLSVRGELVTAAHGRTDRAILREADDAHADLIVLGTHGLSALSRFVLGSVANQVVHGAHVPVLVVR